VEGYRRLYTQQIAEISLALNLVIGLVGLVIYFLDPSAIAFYPYRLREPQVFPDLMAGICILSIVLSNLYVLARIVLNGHLRIGWISRFWHYERGSRSNKVLTLFMGIGDVFGHGLIWIALSAGWPVLLFAVFSLYSSSPRPPEAIILVALLSVVSFSIAFTRFSIALHWILTSAADLDDQLANKF
jgi:hypothetical protein